MPQSARLTVIGSFSLYSMSYHQNVVTYQLSYNLGVIPVDVLMFCALFRMSKDSSIRGIQLGSTVVSELIVFVSLLEYSGYSIVRRGEMKGLEAFVELHIVEQYSLGLL